MCTLFFNSSLDDSTPEELITNSNDTHGKTLLQDFIYKASVFSKQFIDKKLQEIQDINNNRQKLLNTKEKLQIIIHNTDTIDIEKPINLINNHNKVWESAPKDLYKVTEYNESLECSVSEEESDITTKLNDYNSKLTESIVDKFPKISIASLSISDASFQNAYDIYKKSYLEYVEPLDVIYYYSPEANQDGSEKEITNRHSPFSLTTNMMTLSESNACKHITESKPSMCACPKCSLF